MSQTNTNTNNGQNRNQNSRRGGRGQGGSSSRGGGNCHNDCRNKSIVKYAFEGKIKDSPISKLLITKTWHRPTYTRENIGLIRLFVTSDLPVLEPVQFKNKLLLAYITVLILYGSIFINNSFHPV